MKLEHYCQAHGCTAPMRAMLGVHNIHPFENWNWKVTCWIACDPVLFLCVLQKSEESLPTLNEHWTDKPALEMNSKFSKKKKKWNELWWGHRSYTWTFHVTPFGLLLWVKAEHKQIALFFFWKTKTNGIINLNTKQCIRLSLICFLLQVPVFLAVAFSTF
jgi:hypothetical protein